MLLQGEGVALGLERGVAGELFGNGDVGHGGECEWNIGKQLHATVQRITLKVIYACSQ